MVLNFFNISGGEIFIILLIVFLFFGPDKIPEIARWIGKGVGEVKKATSEIRDEITRETSDIKNHTEKLKSDLTVENPLRKSPNKDTKSSGEEINGDEKQTGESGS